MKKGFFLILVLVFLLSGCTERTKYGDCVGVLDQKQPNLTYSYSGWNIFMGLFFSQTIIVPGVVVAKDLWCPDGKR